MKTVSVLTTRSSPSGSVGGCAEKVQPTCGSLPGASSNGRLSTLMVPLLPGGLGVAPAICGIAKLVAMSIAVSRPTSETARLGTLLARIWSPARCTRFPCKSPRPSGPATLLPECSAYGLARWQEPLQKRPGEGKPGTGVDLGKCDSVRYRSGREADSL